ncbi:hypothetical protein Tco_0649159 [Tanacetum coccineum]
MYTYDRHAPRTLRSDQASFGGVTNQQSQSARDCHQLSMFHPQASQVIHSQSSVIHLQSSQAPDVSQQSPCTQPTKVQNSAWFKEKMLLAQVQDARIALSKEQLAILADTGDKVDSSPDCDEVPTAQASFMANFSNHNLDVISEVPTYNTNHDNHVFEQNVQEMQDYEQQAFVDDSNDEFTSESNMISYEQYLKENESQVVHNTPSPANQDSMIMSVIEQMSNQVAICNAEYKENQVINESLTAKLERYKERIKTFEQRVNIHLNSREKLIDS